MTMYDMQTKYFRKDSNYNINLVNKSQDTMYVQITIDNFNIGSWILVPQTNSFVINYYGRNQDFGFRPFEKTGMSRVVANFYILKPIYSQRYFHEPVTKINKTAYNMFNMFKTELDGGIAKSCTSEHSSCTKIPESKYFSKNMALGIAGEKFITEKNYELQFIGSKIINMIEKKEEKSVAPVDNPYNAFWRYNQPSIYRAIMQKYPLWN